MVRFDTGLPSYIEVLLDQVEKNSGYPIEMREEPFLEFDSEIQMATSARRPHVLRYQAPYRAYRDHFLVSASAKILRTYAEPPENRMLPATDENRGLPEEDEQEMRGKVGVLFPGDHFAAMSKFLYRGLVRQVFSFPVDLRVEREIREGVPEHRKRQNAYLRRQVKDLEPTLDPRMEEFIPERACRASAAMNIAFAETIGEIAGVAPAPAFRRNRYRSLGERLVERLRGVEEPGLPGDRKATDAWAQELGLEGWYEWVRWGEP